MKRYCLNYALFCNSLLRKNNIPIQDMHTHKALRSALLMQQLISHIFTFPLRVFKWTITFEIRFIPSWTNRFKPHPHTRCLSGLTSSPSNNVAYLLTFAWRWARIAMTLSAEIWRFGYSKPYVMSDLIQNISKTSHVRWKLKIDTWLII